MNIPARLSLANLPTKIEKLERLSQKLGGPQIYIKRDDQTGTEVSGNKIRKLEFSVKEALDLGCDYLITCGGIQSNHCRATAAVAAKLGLKAALVLRKSGNEEIDGNLLLDKLLGAETFFVSLEEDEKRRDEILEEVKKSAEKKGFKPYIIPGGASNGIGAFGYFKAIEEIKKQEDELGINFDMIASAVGSGGTYSGLFLGKKLLSHTADIFGVNVCDSREYFVDKISGIICESLKYLNVELEYDKKEIHIIDGYVGKGYAISSPGELEFLSYLAKLEGIILDPVYTGKALYGICQELKKGRLKQYKNILFIHTGGVFGIFPHKNQFNFSGITF